MKKIDLRHTAEYKTFRDSIMTKENSCRRCGSKLKLQLHHLKSCAKFPKLVLDPANVVVLCVDCHHLTHNGWK